MKKIRKYGKNGMDELNLKEQVECSLESVQFKGLNMEPSFIIMLK